VSTPRRPDLDELIGDDVPPAERERLQRVHELLLQAGPPPELPQALELIEDEPANVYPLFPKRRWAAAAAVAAALVALAFGGGYLVGHRNDELKAERIVTMAAVDKSSQARASLALFAIDDGGNWPMELTVRGLAALPEGRTYSLWLTKDGKPAALCGEFVVAGDKTVVPLNAPFKLKRFDGWIVTRTGSDAPVLTT
jgi:hypothetical protein